MSEKTDSKQRKHLFQPGQSGNPAGKPKGARNHATRIVQALIDGRAEEVVEKALELALAGDGPVLRAILDRLCPPRKEAPIRLVEMPEIAGVADIPGALTAVLAGVATGTLTPSEGATLASIVNSCGKAFELVELEERIAMLEAAAKETSRG